MVASAWLSKTLKVLKLCFLSFDVCIDVLICSPLCLSGEHGTRGERWRSSLFKSKFLVCLSD